MKLRGERVRSGTLSQRTKKKQLCNGTIEEYPLVSGKRDPSNVNHWYWQLTYKAKGDDGKYRSRTASVRPEQVEAVKVLIVGNAPLEIILSYLASSK